MKKAMLVYGPFTYVMDVPEFRDEIRVLEPMTMPILRDYLAKDELPTQVPYHQLVFRPRGFTSKDIMEYGFVERI